jgi:GH15 family glucan-1,4-alpha-glucosidase
MRSTYAAIEARLGAGPGLLYRNERSRSREGAFGICSFWAAEHLARGGGSGAAARRYFEQALGYANDVGLFAEEIDPATGAALGNFPQAFTHVGLISAALSLEERERSEARGAPGDRAKADDARRAPPPAHTPGAPPGAESQP